MLTEQLDLPVRLEYFGAQGDKGLSSPAIHQLQGGDLNLGEAMARVALEACPKIALGVDNSFVEICGQTAVHHPQPHHFRLLQ